MDFTNFKNLAIGLNLSDNYLKALYVQAALETGNFTSNLFRKNNLFGMKKAYKRVQDGVVGMDKNEHVFYASLKDSLIDRVNWDNQQKILPPLSESDILHYFNSVQSKGYAEDKNYINKLSNVYASFFGGVATQPVNLARKKVSFAVPVVLAAFAAGLYFYRNKIKNLIS